MKKILLIITLFAFGTINAQIENEMVAHFPFDNNTTDISTSSIIATNNNCSFTQDRNGVANNAIDFNNNGYIIFSDNSLKKQFPITVSFWLNVNSINEVNTLFMTDNVFDNYHGVWMSTLPSGQILISFGGGIGNFHPTNCRYYVTNDVNIVPGTWYNVVGIIRDYNDMDIYIDCVETNGTYKGTGPTTVAYSSSGDSRIGGVIGNITYPEDKFTDGIMDQFAFWDRELSSTEIASLCDKNNVLSVNEYEQKSKKLIRVIDLLGRDVSFSLKKTSSIYINIYDDGSTEKVLQIN